MMTDNSRETTSDCDGDRPASVVVVVANVVASVVLTDDGCVGC